MCCIEGLCPGWVPISDPEADGSDFSPSSCSPSLLVGVAVATPNASFSPLTVAASGKGSDLTGLFPAAPQGSAVCD